MTLVSEIKLNQATAMLLETELKVSEIAEMCGYGSTEHFFRTFKDKYGCTPTEFREKAKIPN